MESTFASRVLELLRSTGLSQQAFAERCGLEQSNISQMEKGTDPKTSNAAKIIAAFPDISAVWLLTGEGRITDTGRVLVKKESAPATQSIDSAEPADEAKMPATVKRRYQAPMAVARDMEEMTKDEQIAYYKALAEMAEERAASYEAAQRHETAVRLVRTAGGQSFTSASLDAADTHETAVMAVSHRNAEYQRFKPATRTAPERLAIRRWGNS